MKLVFLYLFTNIGNAKKCGFQNVEKLTEISPTPLGEISGGAFSSSGRYWVINDSEQTHPTFYEIAPEKQFLHSWEVLGVEQNDWEDMDVWIDNLGKKQIYIADTGGNNGLIDTFHIYSFPEPTLSETTIRPMKFTVSFQEYGHLDIEGFAIDPRSGDWYFLNKGWWSPSRFFTIQDKGNPQVIANFSSRPIMKTSSELRQYTPKSIGRLQPNSTHRKRIYSNIQWYRSLPYFPTSMDFSPDGQTLLVRSYLFGYTWHRDEYQNWQEVLGQKPCRIILPVRRRNLQGETIFFDDDGRFVYLISENSLEPHPIYRIELMEK